jgi:DNA-binding transcriptional ArsR family regulator
MLTPAEYAKLKKHVSQSDKRLVEVFDALSDKNRCNLFRLIVKRPGINVSESANVLSLSLPLVSQHFKILEQNNLLVKTKSGKEVHYVLNIKDPIVLAIVGVIAP